MRRMLAALLALMLPAGAGAQSYEPAKLDRAFAALQSAEAVTAGAALAEIWRRWLVLDDREQNLQMELGIAEMRRGELAEAAATFTRLIEQAPDLPEPWHKRGSVRMLQGELEPAVADFCATIQRERRHFGAYSNLGGVRLQLKEPARAIAAYGLALKYNPHMPGLKPELERLKGEAVGEMPADPLGCGLRTAGR
jgi:tetratricopeptide (TPR) repeat protein